MATIEHHEVFDRRPHLECLHTDLKGNMGIVYQPGDGTRYTLLFKVINESERKALGGAEDSVLLSYFRGSNSFRSMLISEYSVPYYIEEKLDCNSVTAEVIYKAAQFYFNGTDVGPSLYEKGAA